MLQGSLENFALDEVLGLLSGTSKTGQLEINGDRGSGTLAFSEGRLTDGTCSSTVNGTELEDVMFEMLRFADGTFSFSSREPGPVESSEDVGTILAGAEHRLRDWRLIEAVVPTLDHRVAPATELPADEVTISRDEWAALTVIASGCPVSNVCDRLELGEVEGSRQIKNLAERQLVVVSEPQNGIGSLGSSTSRTSSATGYRPLGGSTVGAGSLASVGGSLDPAGYASPGLGENGGPEATGSGNGNGHAGSDATGPSGGLDAPGSEPADDAPGQDSPSLESSSLDSTDHEWPGTKSTATERRAGETAHDPASTEPPDSADAVDNALAGDGSLADPFASDSTPLATAATGHAPGTAPARGSLMTDEKRPPMPPPPPGAAPEATAEVPVGLVPPMPPMSGEVTSADDVDSDRDGGRGLLARYLKSED